MGKGVCGSGETHGVGLAGPCHGSGGLVVRGIFRDFILLFLFSL